MRVNGPFQRAPGSDLAWPEHDFKLPPVLPFHYASIATIFLISKFS